MTTSVFGRPLPEAPARPAPSLIYDHIPLLEELYDRGGIPGEVYALIPLQHEYDMQQGGWERIKGSPVFRLVGPLGECQFILMRDLAHTYIQGLRPEGGRRQCFYHDELTTLTGLIPGETLGEATERLQPLTPPIEPMRGPLTSMPDPTESASPPATDTLTEDREQGGAAMGAMGSGSPTPPTRRRNTFKPDSTIVDVGMEDE